MGCFNRWRTKKYQLQVGEYPKHSTRFWTELFFFVCPLCYIFFYIYKYIYMLQRIHHWSVHFVQKPFHANVPDLLPCHQSQCSSIGRWPWADDGLPPLRFRGRRKFSGLFPMTSKELRISQQIVWNRLLNLKRNIRSILIRLKNIQKIPADLKFPDHRCKYLWCRCWCHQTITMNEAKQFLFSMRSW